MMESYWDDLDGEILGILKTAGPSDPASLARVLGMSTSAVCSCLAMLSPRGRFRSARWRSVLSLSHAWREGRRGRREYRGARAPPGYRPKRYASVAPMMCAV